MKQITYTFSNGEQRIIEVSDEVADALAELDRTEHANDEKQRYHCYSLDQCSFEGSDFAYQDEGFTSLFAELSDEERLEMAMKSLTECQKAAINAVYFQGMSQEEYAQSIGVSHQVISKHLKYAIKKLKKFFE